MNNKNCPHIPVKTGMQGFSLIEFLVASALSMIVLLAVSSGYFTARSLNTAATSRLNVQQDLRNASNQIVRDARMAGNFGCFNMSAYDAQAVIADSGSKDFLKLKGSGNMLPAVRETDSLGVTDFEQSGKALIFQYGIDTASPNEATVVASSCTNITKPGKQITDSKAALKTDGSQAGNISIMKHEVNAYAVGTVGRQEGLYRFQLTDDGEWSNPQLLIKGIKGMKIRYFYVEKCPQTDVESKAASAPTGNTQNQGQTLGEDETFTYSDELPPKNPDLAKETPASIELLLNSNDKRELGSINAGGSNDNEVKIYRINATVRGGNKCADRLL
ncbi:prepilin-type N-terminal cleavage/methylation domain-containing protein [Neisseria sp. DTU_2020_1000833_1_SI_GRL_NUU_006]|uniref:PilW family protein n=1 Tax=Neisseria sicca TaxID=490 RepID=UPI002B2B7B8D|nr:prepilin-type N-terminal cleavage/methylation domain-containing protein [Neisseria sp. DTU_2020_1000833_1_SI_GRL_NUU_006]